MENFQFSYPRYLQAKRSVDQRARSVHVWTRFIDVLRDNSGSGIRILEVGGGTGSTLQRLLAALEREDISSIEYTFVEKEPDNVAVAISSVKKWATNRGNSVEETSNILQWNGGTVSETTLRFVTTDLFQFTPRATRESYDAIIAQSVFDLLDVRAALKQLATLLDSSGFWYLPMHFDGLTAFEPTIDPRLDQRIVELYHESMRDPYTGRRLLNELRDAGSELREVEGSDWIVFGNEGEYPENEEYFLQCILYFIRQEVLDTSIMEEHKFTKWISERRQQIETGSLLYLAHQIDILAQK